MRLFFLLFVLSISLFGAETSQICYFSPPSGWEIAQPKNTSSFVQVGFVGKGSTHFRPSVNLALEEVDVSLKEYLKAVKKIHTSQPNTQWRDLGKFQMAAGEGRLTEISSSSAWGDLKMLQAIFVKGNIAYILTGAVLRSEFSLIQNELLKSLQSLNLTPNFWLPISNEEKRKEVEQVFASLGSFLPEIDIETQKKEQWEYVQKTLSQGTSELGPHWQYLALKEGYAKIHSAATQSTH